MELIKAICLKTYQDEDDLDAFENGEIHENDIRTYNKGDIRYVVKDLYHRDYYKPID